MVSAVRQVLSDIMAHIPRWQLFGALAAAVVLLVLRRYALAKLVVVVAFFAWIMAYAVDNLDLSAGFASNVWQFAVMAGSIVIVLAVWVHFIR